MFTCIIETPLGLMQAAGDDEALKGLWFIGQKHFPVTNTWAENPEYPVFKKAGAWLKDYFAGKKPSLNFKLCPAGTLFQKEIWNKLMAIPWGRTVSYGMLFPASARAAGNAVGRNPVSIIIPCHRVIGSKGSITGYAGGLDRKAALLELEGIKLAAQRRSATNS
ncbi:MAG: methylated-DNA--[protein]-cysteine S-methyltransferase [Treponema sp.]|jgi:methylated-DNA-[protein]-cysteine S-methyltransferase|nr:methylated-DNA--[protein]-cysteine S-methyltransferase [Treponema sp.]